VIVADCAAHSQAQERGSVSLGAVASDVEAQFLWNGPAFVAAFAQSYVAAGDQRVEVPGRKQVARNLLGGKLVKGLVAVEGSDYVIAIRPDVAAIVEVQPVGIGIANVVQPVARALLSERGAGEQIVNKVLVCVR
jgi:hypothetical protein